MKLLGWMTLIALVGACDSSAPEPSAPVIRPVRVQRVSNGGGERVRSFSATAKADTETQLSFQVAGTLVGFHLKVGDKVKKGQSVARLEAIDQALMVQEARAGVAQAEAQRLNAQASYDRVRLLYENNNATQSQLDAARAARDSATAAVAGAKKRLELAQSQAGKTRLNVPVEGVVAKVLAENGENVSPGQAVAVINSGARTQVEFAVPEALIVSVKLDQKATVVFDAVRGERFEATVTEVGVTPSSTATTYPVIATLVKDDDRVKSGMAAEVQLHFDVDKVEHKLLVNPKAVGEDRQGRFAYVAKPTEPGFAKVERRAVEVGEISTGGLEVLSGIEEGELVVTAGLTYLEEGKRVRLPASETSKPAVNEEGATPAGGAGSPASVETPVASGGTEGK